MRFTFVGFQGSSDLSTLPDTWARLATSALAELPDHTCVYVPDGVGVTHFIGISQENLPEHISSESFDSWKWSMSFPRLEF